MNVIHFWNRVALSPAILAGLTLVASGCSTTANESKSTSALSQDLSDAAIERYIRTHPEVIEQSLQALEVKREAELRDRQ